VAGPDPVCVVSVLAFNDPAAKKRWMELVGWLMKRTK
jgi:hypothetical protein